MILITSSPDKTLHRASVIRRRWPSTSSSSRGLLRSTACACTHNDIDTKKRPQQQETVVKLKQPPFTL
ncbi:hypothetical protein L5515_004823 [Caenorhabditis briggsae]|uniref:Uncharacterized protein n=1 Tax=Caenorhabditis briggsae TaxID=6238 RepID=A0AAE9ELS9_CAEBR|nr:hypothetical protein L5515_004823 [Caenorhabditis briggsae]